MGQIQITAIDQRIVTTNSESYITLTISQIVRNADFKCHYRLEDTMLYETFGIQNDNKIECDVVKMELPNISPLFVNVGLVAT